MRDLDLHRMDVLHIEDIVSIHCESFPESRSTQLGRPFLRRMYRWYHLYQPQLSIVAESEGELVGFVTGAIGGSSRRIFRDAFPWGGWGFLRRPTLMFQAEMYEMWQSYLRGLFPGKGSGKPTLQQSERPVKATLDSIAVRLGARGQGIGSALVYAFEDAARGRGATVLSLGVELDNLPAQRLYQQCGWRLNREDVVRNASNYIKEIRSV